MGIGHRDRSCLSWEKTLSCFEDPLPANHRTLYRDVDERKRVVPSGIPTENHQIRKLTRLNRALKFFFKRSVGTVYGSHSERFFNRHTLLRPPQVTSSIYTSHLRSERHHRLERPGRII